MDLTEKKEYVRELVKKRGAILIAHNYQRAEVQQVADMTGDSLGLSISAARTEASVIVFCGVHFMAETASILAPDKTVLLPRNDAGCPMADTIDAERLRAKKAELPGVPVISYVNTTAEVKAESDYCCTSANVVQVVNHLDSQRVFMTPDRNLARYAQRHTQKEVLYWDGCCNVHDRLSLADLEAARAAHPGAVVVAHPECRPEVLDMADIIRSTSGMITYCETAPADEFIIATENGILHQLRTRYPARRFYPAAEHMLCPNMKKTTLDHVITALETLAPEVRVAPGIRARALVPVERMLAIPRD